MTAKAKSKPQEQKMDTARAVALVAKHGNVSAAARAAGVHESTMSKHYARRAGAAAVSARTVTKSPPPATPKSRTIADFQRENDQAWKIRDGIKRLFGGGVYMTDAEFREAVGGNPARWRAAADATEFSDNRLRHKGEILWAATGTITEMKQILGVAI